MKMVSIFSLVMRSADCPYCTLHVIICSSLTLTTIEIYSNNMWNTKKVVYQLEDKSQLTQSARNECGVPERVGNCE